VIGGRAAGAFALDQLLDLAWFGGRIAEESLWDPAGERIRA
jgi:hypothetical protein